MDDTLSWPYHITEITLKIAKSTYHLARIKNFIGDCCRKTFYHAYIHDKIKCGVLPLGGGGGGGGLPIS